MNTYALIILEVPLCGYRKLLPVIYVFFLFVIACVLVVSCDLRQRRTSSNQFSSIEGLGDIVVRSC